MENPFVSEFPDDGGKGGAGVPPRPPPPRPSSPPKTAFDDLNSSIRMAMGGGAPSPSKPPLPSNPPQSQIPQAPYQIPPQTNPQAIYGSPAKIPMAALQGGVESQAGKVLTGDLDSSLALLAENLTMNKGNQPGQKGMQWNSPKNTAKAGGTGWSPQPMAATTGANYRPMGMMPGGVGSPRQVPPTAQPPSQVQELDPFGAL